MEDKSTWLAVIPENRQNNDARKGDGAKSAPADAVPAIDSASLYVFVAYDDRLAYGRALGTLANVARVLNDEDIELRPLPWPFDVLAETSWQALAFADAAKATIFVLSTSVAEALPETIHAWLPACLGGQRESPLAVMALLGSPDHRDGLESPRYQFVRDIARRAGCDFIEPMPFATDSAALEVGTVIAT